MRPRNPVPGIWREGIWKDAGGTEQTHRKIASWPEEAVRCGFSPKVGVFWAHEKTDQNLCTQTLSRLVEKEAFAMFSDSLAEVIHTNVVPVLGNALFLLHSFSKRWNVFLRTGNVSFLQKYIFALRKRTLLLETFLVFPVHRTHSSPVS